MKFTNPTMAVTQPLTLGRVTFFSDGAQPMECDPMRLAKDVDPLAIGADGHLEIANALHMIHASMDDRVMTESEAKAIHADLTSEFIPITPEQSRILPSRKR